MKGMKAQVAWGTVHLALLPTNEDRAKAIVDWAGAGLTHQRSGRITVESDESETRADERRRDGMLGRAVPRSSRHRGGRDDERRPCRPRRPRRRRPASDDRGRVRRLRHHRRPGEGDDLPLAVPARAARPARLPDRRRRGRRLDGRPARASARASRSSAPASSSTRTVFERFAARLSYVAGDFGDAATYERVAEAIDGAETPGLLPRDPAVPVRHGRQGARRGRPDEERRASSSRSRSATTSRRRARSPTSSTSTSTSRSSTGSTTSSGRWASTEILYLRFANTMLEPVWNRNYVASRPDHDGRGLRRRGPRPLLRPGRRAARRRRQPPDAGGRRRRDGAAGRRRPGDAQGRAGRALPRDAGRRPGALRARPVRRLPRRSTASRRTRRPRPTPRCGSRSTTGAGRACRSSSAPASACRSRRPSCGSSSSTPPRLGLRSCDAADPSRTSSSSSSTRRPGSGCSSTRSAPTRPAPEQIDLDMEFAERGRRGRRRRTRCCCTPRWSATARASPARTASRRPGGSCSRCSTRRRRCTRTRRARGARRRRTSWSPGTAAGTSPWVAS